MSASSPRPTRICASRSQQGLFREDLFFRLNVVPIRLPPLRERVEDIPDLVRHFFQIAEKEGLPRKQVDSEAMDVMRRYRWPGNVRELENLVRRLAALYPQEVDHRPDRRGRTRSRPLRPPAMPTAQRKSAPRRCRVSVERHLSQYFVGFGDNIPPPGLYHRILREVEPPLIAAALAATRAATRSRRPSCSGSTATPCARRSANSTCRWCAPPIAECRGGLGGRLPACHILTTPLRRRISGRAFTAAFGCNVPARSEELSKLP